MPVPTDDGVERYTGNGATSLFSVGFYFQSADDLTVYVRHTTTRTRTTLVRGTDYTVSGAGDPDGGSITLIGNYANLSSSYNLTILLEPDLSDNASISARTSNATLQASIDKLHQIAIKHQEELDRCYKLPEDEAPTAAKTIVPISADRLSKSFTYDSSGNPTASSAASNTSINFTAIGESIAEAANAGAVLDALGFSATGKAIIDDANAAAVRTTIGIDGASGVIAAGDLASNSVTTAKITDANVTAIKLANDAVAPIFQARLTLTSATPVLTSDTTSSTIYLTPYKGNGIGLYNGTIWKYYRLTEISLALSALTASRPYDVWVYDNSGTLTLDLTAWTNATTRATALAFQNGVYVKNGDATRRYVGTIYTTDTNQTKFGSGSTGFGPYVWNYYNRVPWVIEKTISTASWNYTTATWRQMEGSASNQVDWCLGVQGETMLNFWLQARSSNGATGTDRRVGVGVDSTSSPNMASNAFEEATTAVYPHFVSRWDTAAIGYHYAAMLEYSEAANTTTWYGADSVAGAAGGTRLRVFGYW
jgi:hypothetical protein